MQRSRILLAFASLGLALLFAAPVQAYENGNLPQSALGEIYHPQYTVYLEKDAAAAWTALREYCLARGVDMYPNGANSAYRTYAQQVEMKKLYGSNAATPGTSNHGLGIAVDVATQEMRTAIDKWGAQFGWSKKWSDASWEWWHIKYKAGVWKGKAPAAPAPASADDGLPLPPKPTTATATPAASPATPTDAPAPANQDGSQPTAPPSSVGLANSLTNATNDANRPEIQRGASGADVRELQQLLKARGYTVSVDGDFGAATQKAVESFQRSEGLSHDGVVGPKTWAALAKTSGAKGH
jgi:hypothetical protein